MDADIAGYKIPSLPSSTSTVAPHLIPLPHWHHDFRVISLVYMSYTLFAHGDISFVGLMLVMLKSAWREPEELLSSFVLGNQALVCSLLCTCICSPLSHSLS